MPTDLTVILEDRPGALAKVGEALGRAGINIEGICGVTVSGKGTVHILVENGKKARQVLDANHIDVAKEVEVLVVPVEDRPAVLGNIARRLATAGVSLNLAYLATSTRLVIGTDDLEKAREAVQTKKS